MSLTKRWTLALLVGLMLSLLVAGGGGCGPEPRCHEGHCHADAGTDGG